MPISRDDPAELPGRELAIAAEGLFLANLLLIPVIGFALLLWLRLRTPPAPQTPALALCHLQQTMNASIWGGMLLVLISALILVMGGLQWAWTWVIVVLYFTTIHSTLIMLGIIGLSRALAGRPFRYPLIGRPIPVVGRSDDC